MILLNKANLQCVIPAVSDEQSRYTLRAVNVTKTHTEATNGHMLIRVSLPEQKPGNFPVVEGFNANGFEKGLLPVETAKAVLKAMPKERHMPILNHAAISSHEGQVQIAVTNLKSPQVFQPVTVSGQFPNSDSLVELVTKQEVKATVTLNPEYLEALAKSAKQFGARSVKIEVRAEDKAVSMTATNDGQTWYGLLMPIRG